MTPIREKLKKGTYYTLSDQGSVDLDSALAQKKKNYIEDPSDLNMKIY